MPQKQKKVKENKVLQKPKRPSFIEQIEQKMKNANMSQEEINLINIMILIKDKDQEKKKIFLNKIFLNSSLKECETELFSYLAKSQVEKNIDYQKREYKFIPLIPGYKDPKNEKALEIDPYLMDRLEPSLKKENQEIRVKIIQKGNLSEDFLKKIDIKNFIHIKEYLSYNLIQLNFLILMFKYLSENFINIFNYGQNFFQNFLNNIQNEDGSFYLNKYFYHLIDDKALIEYHPLMAVAPQITWDNCLPYKLNILYSCISWYFISVVARFLSVFFQTLTSNLLRNYTQNFEGYTQSNKSKLKSIVNILANRNIEWMSLVILNLFNYYFQGQILNQFLDAIVFFDNTSLLQKLFICLYYAFINFTCYLFFLSLHINLLIYFDNLLEQLIAQQVANTLKTKDQESN